MRSNFDEVYNQTWDPNNEKKKFQNFSFLKINKKC